MDQLLTLLDEAIQVYPDHPDGHLVQTQLKSLTSEYKNSMHEGRQAIRKGQFQQAQSNLKRAWELNPGFPRITELIEIVSEANRQVETARAKVDAAIQRQDWNTAKAWARAIDQYVESVKEMATSPCY